MAECAAPSGLAKTASSMKLKGHLGFLRTDLRSSRFRLHRFQRLELQRHRIFYWAGGAVLAVDVEDSDGSTLPPMSPVGLRAQLIVGFVAIGLARFEPVLSPALMVVRRGKELVVDLVLRLGRGLTGSSSEGALWIAGGAAAVAADFALSDKKNQLKKMRESPGTSTKIRRSHRWTNSTNQSVSG
jgi:hypothetical protein